jgi:hypothetical protein
MNLSIIRPQNVFAEVKKYWPIANQPQAASLRHINEAG